MPSSIVWRGDAPAKSQHLRVMISAGTISESSDLRATINGKIVTAQAGADSKNALLANFRTAWNASNIAEFAEVTAIYSTDAYGDGYVDLIADTPGKPFDVTIEGPFPTIDVDKISDATAGTNEVQRFWFEVPLPTSGTFEVDWDLGSGVENSDAIAFNANADQVKAKMVSGMASLEEEDILVSGAGTESNPFVVAVTSQGQYASQNLNELSLDTAGLSSPASVDIETIQNPGSITTEVQAIWFEWNPYGLTDYQASISFSTDGGDTFPIDDSASWPNNYNYLWQISGSDTVQVAEGRWTAFETWIQENLGVSTRCHVFHNYMSYGTESGSPRSLALITVEFLDGASHDLLGFRIQEQSIYTTVPSEPNVVVRKIRDGGTGAKNHLTVVNSGLYFDPYTNAQFVKGQVFTHNSNDSALSGGSSPDTYPLATDIEGVSSVGAANCTFHCYSGNDKTGAQVEALDIDQQTLYVVEFEGSLASAAQNVTQNFGTITNSATATGKGGSYSISVGEAAPNEKQSITVYGDGGSYDLDWDGNGPSTINIATHSANLVTALDAQIGSGNYVLTGAGTQAEPWIVEFINTYAGTDVAEMTANAGSLTQTVQSDVDTLTPGSAGDPDVWTITLTGATGGTFTLSFLDKETTDIAYNAAASAVQTALQALVSVGSGGMTVSGSAGGPYTVTTAGRLLQLGNPDIVATNEDLTGTGHPTTVTVTTLQASTGPHHADEPLNYVGGAFPVNGDTLIFRNSDVDVLYGLDALNGVTLAQLDVFASYTGRIGLDRYDEDGDYYQYRDLDFQVSATVLNVGKDEGGGSTRVRFDLGNVACTALIYSTGSPDGDWYKALVLNGGNASNSITVLSGSIDLAPDQEDTGQWPVIKTSFVGSQSSDVDLRSGEGCTLGAVTMNGGRVVVNSATTTVVATGGEFRADAGVQASISLTNARFDWRTTDEVTNLTANNSVVDLSKDAQAKDFASANTIVLNGPDAQLLDPIGVLPANVKILKTLGSETIQLPAGKTHTIS